MKSFSKNNYIYELRKWISMIIKLKKNHKRINRHHRKHYWKHNNKDKNYTMILIHCTKVM